MATCRAQFAHCREPSETKKGSVVGACMRVGWSGPEKAMVDSPSTSDGPIDQESPDNGHHPKAVDRWRWRLQKGGDPAAASATATLLRLHPNHRPHPRRVPPDKLVRPPASGVAGFRGVTGGVYKAREHIHRGVADPRLLATPPSWRRVSASNPNRDRLFGIRSPSQVCSPLYRPM